jgi:regulator of protease activity HflC (stomatin/prohibitin superfamily)
LHPPERVVDAFHEVARAMERRDWRVNKARAEEIRLKSDAEAGAMRSVRQAQGDAEKKVLLAEAARDGFLAREQARRQLTWTDEWRLLSEAAATVAAGDPAGSAYQRYQQQRQQRLAMQPYLTDYRLSVRGLAGALQQRDKIILDSDKVPGKRSLFLFDPELFRAPPPMIFQGDRTPSRSPRSEE